MLLKKIATLALLLTVGLRAETDPAAYQKQQKDIERRESRELQKVDQAEEQERIKVRTRERDELAKVQRDALVTTGAATATVVATGSMATLDYAKLAAIKFAEDEVRNMVQNQLNPEVATRFTRDRNAINRKYALERAKLDAQQIEGDDAAKQRDQAAKNAEITAKYQAQLDDLNLEQETEAAKLRFTHTTKVNAAERDLAVLTTKHLMEQAGKGAAAVYNPMTDPEYTRLAAVRDAAKSALETALDELRAKINARRTDIENAREDEQAKAAGG